MPRLIALARRMPLVALALVIGAIGLGLLAAGAEPAARWGISIFALTVAAIEAPVPGLDDAAPRATTGSEPVDSEPVVR